MSALINQGNGIFMSRFDYVGGYGALSIAAADRTGDGKPGLAVTNSDAKIVRRAIAARSWDIRYQRG